MPGNQIGDQADMAARLRALLPARWFADAAPVLDGVLAGLGQAASFAYELVGYARQQSRIATAAGTWLDLVSSDLFGGRLSRGLGESDAALRGRIGRETFRARATRAGLVQQITDVTGRAPGVFEPRRPADTGSWGRALAYAGPGAAGVGGWGSLAYLFQCFVVAHRPRSGGIPGVGGYGSPRGGYGLGAFQYADATLVTGIRVDRQILAAIADVMPACGIAWTQIAP